jgi:hypothetical protein
LIKKTVNSVASNGRAWGENSEVREGKLSSFELQNGGSISKVHNERLSSSVSLSPGVEFLWLPSS